MWRDNLRGIFYIALKDLRTYYLKGSAVSWGIVFPITWILAFYLRNPQDFKELVPGLIAMTILFSTTATETVVINFELRLGSLERLLLAPISIASVLLGKVLGGVIFGFLMTTVVTIGSMIMLGLHPNVLYLILIIIPSLFVFSSLGALLCLMVREIFEAQTLLNFPRFLMVFLSGVVYPVSKMPTALQYVAYVLPLSYTVDGLQLSFSGGLSKMVYFYTLILFGFFILFIFPAVKLLHKKFE
ncbi:MAG: multidrug ABC transporter permease [Planctomycetes bacterium RBG_13_46_10]|nr:MAG: multidrug ABC transporter permease [Planctomycetes bacterium RBG_13_46_10]